MGIYKIQVSNNDTFTDLVVSDLVNYPYPNENFNEYYFKTGDLEYGKVYYWRVKRIDLLYGNESNWSTVCEFFTKGEDIIINTNTQIILFEALGIESDCQCKKHITNYESSCSDKKGIHNYETNCLKI
ncbi:MAG: hypothetical protein ACOCZ5_01270 [bacterium]